MLHDFLQTTQKFCGISIFSYELRDSQSIRNQLTSSKNQNLVSETNTMTR